MSKKQVLVAVVVSVFLVSALAVIQLVNLAWAGSMPRPKPGYATISIHSPQEKTYNVNAVPLNFTIKTNTFFSYLSSHYVLDGQAAVKIEQLNVTGQVTIRDDYPYDPYTEYTLEGNAILTNLSDGGHNITVYYPELYYEPTSVTVSFNVDASPPKISILSVKNETYNTTDILLSFTIDQPVSWIRYSLNGQTNVTITGNTTLTELPNGSHILVVYAKDAAGNTGASETVYFSIEVPQPEPKLSDPFPTLIAATIAIIAAIGATLLVYFTKVRKTTEKAEKIKPEGVM